MDNKLFQVRRAVEEDVLYIQSITKHVFKTYQEQVEISGTISALKETIEDIKDDVKTKEVFTALYDGKVVGSVRIELRKDGNAYLSRFGVDPEFQNKGIGKLLINAVDKAMEELNVTNLYLYTASKMLSLVRFYYGRGFYIESTSRDRGYIRALLCKEYKAVQIDGPYQNQIENII